MRIEAKRLNTRNAKRLKTNLKLIITISATLIAIFYSAIKIFFVKENVIIDFWTVALLIFGIAIFYIIIFSLEEGLLVDRIFNIVGKFHSDSYVGNWNISIKYTGDNGSEVLRTGSCRFEDSISGLRIDGGNILNEAGVVEVDDWNSNNVELIEYADETKLIYTYFTYEKNSLRQTKIGLAILTRKSKEKLFEGTFRDFDVQNNGKSVKEGIVKLFKSKSN